MSVAVPACLTGPYTLNKIGHWPRYKKIKIKKRNEIQAINSITAIWIIHRCNLFCMTIFMQCFVSLRLHN